MHRCSAGVTPDRGELGAPLGEDEKDGAWEAISRCRETISTREGLQPSARGGHPRRSSELDGDRLWHQQCPTYSSTYEHLSIRTPGGAPCRNRLLFRRRDCQ